jgi:hypothetical protein
MDGGMNFETKNALIKHFNIAISPNSHTIIKDW